MILRKSNSILIMLFLAFAIVSCEEKAEEISYHDLEISEENLDRHIVYLSSDELKGRMPMTPEEDLILDYLQTELEEIGVEPANNGSFFQDVGLVEVTSKSDDQLTIYGGDSPITLDKGSDYVVYSQLMQDEIVVEDAEIVFCGFGIVAPEYDWNDYKGIDMSGKIALVLVNDPGFYMDEGADLFTGSAMTYYGRWTYKYAEAARQGAEGIIIVHSDAPAGYPWTVVENSWAGTAMQLDLGADAMERAPLQGWVTSEVASKLYQQSNQDESDLLASALKSDFEPVPMGLSLSSTIQNSFTRGTSPNVVGIIPGSERPDEYIVYTSHWDHLGVGNPVDGDSIYNGAVDNATGIAILLEIAREVKKLPEAPARSLVFLMVTAEEQGLLGSEYYAKNPIYPTHKTVANLNVDGIYPFGETNDILVVGYHQNELKDWAETIADSQGRYLLPDQEAEKGFFYRSDQFNFAKVGVPAFYGGGGTDLVDGGKERGEELRMDYNRKYYHKPGDEFNPEVWDLGGIAQDGQFFLRFGIVLANSEEWPAWNENSEFKAIRDADLEGK